MAEHDLESAQCPTQLFWREATPLPHHLPRDRQGLPTEDLARSDLDRCLYGRGQREAADHIPVWVFSFADNPDGFSKRQICALIEDFRRTPKVVPLQHRWSIATEVDHYEAGSKELLIVCQ